jgi:hypothetical protein
VAWEKLKSCGSDLELITNETGRELSSRTVEGRMDMKKVGILSAIEILGYSSH